MSPPTTTTATTARLADLRAQIHALSAQHAQLQHSLDRAHAQRQMRNIAAVREELQEVLGLWEEVEEVVEEVGREEVEEVVEEEGGERQGVVGTVVALVLVISL